MCHKIPFYDIHGWIQGGGWGGCTQDFKGESPHITHKLSKISPKCRISRVIPSHQEFLDPPLLTITWMQMFGLHALWFQNSFWSRLCFELSIINFDNLSVTFQKSLCRAFWFCKKRKLVSFPIICLSKCLQTECRPQAMKNRSGLSQKNKNSTKSWIKSKLD